MARRASDFWQCGLVPIPIAACVDPAALRAIREKVSWLPDPGPWKYLADPFGLHRAGQTHVFVEAFDYRTKHAVIEHHEIGADRVWRGGETVLSGPTHLSYPYLIEDDGEVYMIPEAQRSNEVVLYRAHRFPGDWRREAVLFSGLPIAEPSLIKHNGYWWMFFVIVGANKRDQRELHLAYAKTLTGPWELHPQNPIRRDISSSRPGGTPFHDKSGHVILPVQDCTRTYGWRIRFVRFYELSPGNLLQNALDSSLEAPLISDTHIHGLHTLAACGDCTLIDTKDIRRSYARIWIDWRRRTKRFMRRLRVRGG